MKKYQLLESLDCDLVHFEADDYNTMWRMLIDFRDARNDGNIDGMIIKNTENGIWEFAWRVARNMNDVSGLL